MTPEDEAKGRARGGLARAEALPEARRQEIAKRAAEARWGTDGPPKTVVFAKADGQEFEVLIDEETVWLTPRQMAGLFGRSVTVIRKHVRNAIAEGELEEATNAQKMRVSGAHRPETGYSLDAIISVGYRVKSPIGVQFRRWATGILKERLLQDLERRKAGQSRQLREMQDALRIAKGAIGQIDGTADETKAILDVIERYSRSWSLLIQYDEDRLPGAPAKATGRLARLTYLQAQQAVARLKRALMAKGEASDFFGQERGDGALEAILGNLEQTFGGEALYPTAEIRAAHLLYSVIKNHPFIDGNKRAASLLFLHYVDKCGLLKREDGSAVIDDNALVALALLTAQSDPKDRELMIRLILGFIADATNASPL
jgi:prophage maintenance system killer protein